MKADFILPTTRKCFRVALTTAIIFLTANQTATANTEEIYTINETFTDGSTLNGTISYNPTINSITSDNAIFKTPEISITGYASPPTLYTATGSAQQYGTELYDYVLALKIPVVGSHMQTGYEFWLVYFDLIQNNQGVLQFDLAAHSRANQLYVNNDLNGSSTDYLLDPNKSSITLNAVPLPSALLLFASGLIGFRVSGRKIVTIVGCVSVGTGRARFI